MPMVRSSFRICASFFALMCPGISVVQSLAADECLAGLRDIHRAEASIKLPPQEDMCVYLNATFKIDLRYAEFYRRCGQGIQGENDAFDYEKRASAVKSLISMNCR